MTTKPAPYTRMLPAQATGAKAKQAAMIAANELRLLTYREGYQLADPAQRASLEYTLREEFDTAIALPEVAPDGSAVSYLLVVNGVPVLVPEDDMQPFIAGVVLALGGVGPARRVSYRPDMLPAGSPAKP